MKRIAATLLTLFLTVTTSAHEYRTLEDFIAATDFDSVEVTSERVGAGLFVLFGSGGNVAVTIGAQGVLMVDSQFNPMIPKLKATIVDLGGGEIDFTINTHWHFDHVGGNPFLGREGTWFVSQSNSRRMMTGEHVIDTVTATPMLQPPYVGDSMPIISFENQMQFHFNGNTIDLLHFGPAHTTGDTAVFFREANVVHMGDVFNASYPFIDAGNGGDIEGMARFCSKVLKRLNDDSVVVPGHGPVMGYEEFANYVDMLETVASRIDAMIDAGMSLEDVIAANPTVGFDEQYGDPGRFIDRAYMSLSR